MKNLYYFIVITLFLTACQKDGDEPTKQLATPKISWVTTSVTNNVLEISITIESTEELPLGNLKFRVDNVLIDDFNPSKGNNSYTTNYTFTDENEHKALISYSFTDKRPSITKTVKVNRFLIKTTETSTKEDWKDL